MSNEMSRRTFLDLAALALAAQTIGAGCGSAGDESEGESSSADVTPGTYAAGVASFRDPSLRAAAVRRAIDLAGGMRWLKTGDRVVIKPAHNSPNPYPFTASPVACAELVKLCLAGGAKQVVIADVMGIEHTLRPGAWRLEDPYGSTLFGFNPNSDATVLAFKKSGLYAAIEQAVGASNIGPDKRVHITSWREKGWSRFESRGAMPPGTAATVKDRLTAGWVRDQLWNSENWEGKNEYRVYIPRQFDFFRAEVPGMYVPNALLETDHVINLYRCSTHIWSHFTMALKNWIGIMRPDERVWLHQLNYLKNKRRSNGSEAIRTEMVYHEMLADLHLATWQKERLHVCDATKVIVSGGPDKTDKSMVDANLVVAATDLVSADVVGLSVLRWAIQMAGGFECAPQPKNMAALAVAFIGASIPWADSSEMHGTDAKLCANNVSDWDWVAIRRARELKMGCPAPANLRLALATDPDHAVANAPATFIQQQVTRAPQFPLFM